MKILTLILNLLFPIECLGCQQDDYYLCNDCLQTIDLKNTNHCPICNKRSERSVICVNCKKDCYCDEIIICTKYTSLIQSCLHLFKYNNVQALAQPLGKLMVQKLTNLQFENYYLIATPLHRKRLRERGFNQAQLLANEIALHFNLPICSDLLIRTKNNQHQVELNREQRLKNMKDCFTLKNAEFVKNKNFLIVDDVLTTSATVNEQAKLLKNHGAKSVSVVVIAKNV